MLGGGAPSAAPMIAPRLSGAKKSETGTVPATTPRKRFVCSWFARYAPNNCRVCASGSASAASCAVKSTIGITASLRARS